MITKYCKCFFSPCLNIPCHYHSYFYIFLPQDGASYVMCDWFLPKNCNIHFKNVECSELESN